VAVAGLLVAAGSVYLSAAVTWRQGALFLVGTMAGVVLYHAAFGFTSSWRATIAEKRGEGLRAQIAVVNVATLAMAGCPWGVTSAFALWGSKILAAVGVDVAS
jgi:hypothetical protein